MNVVTSAGSSALPAIGLSPLSLPKGGGAIEGLGETLNAGGVNGTVLLTLPLPITDTGGDTPALSLNYSSGAGNGIFGLGVSLSVPSISRRTAKGVPRYTESDEFVDASGEVLVRVGDVSRQPLNERSFQVTPFASRVASSFDRLEYWQAQDDGSCAFWCVQAADGTQHLFGYTADARVADPATPERIVRWCLEESVTPHGEHLYYTYQNEDDRGIDTRVPVEQSRERRAQRYLKRVCFGNRRACAKLYLLSGMPVPTDWHFELVFDYGEHAADANALPTYAPQRAWCARRDPFSDYSVGFEVRTHRLCRQVLMFHRFDALGTDPVLVRRVYLEYDEQPVFSRLRAAWMTGYGPNPGSGEPAVVSLPPLEFGFGAFTLAQSRFEPFEPLAGLNDGALYQLVDLYGEGVPGVLYRDGTSYWYRAPVRASSGDDVIAYDAWQPLPQLPTGGIGPSGRSSLMDLTGDGQLDWVVAQPGMAGFFSLGPDKRWQAFVPFSAFPTEFLHPEAQLVDLVGAGLPDLALIGPKSVRLYANRREAGFAVPEEVAHESDRLPGGGSAFNELVAFSDMLGSGQSHLVRVRHDVLVVWPNLGRGRLGAPITLATLPFDWDTFDPARVRLADLDGSGAADLIYLEKDHLLVFLNQSGNGLASPVTLAWPDGVRYAPTCQVSFADVSGTGCAALVLTVPHPSPRHWIMDFAAGKKPYLLERINNNRGWDTQLSYRSSAQAWLDEKQATPNAVSHLPFPVQLISQLTQTDEVTGNTLTQRYLYRHGFYDGQEREFAGFGYCEQWDIEHHATSERDDDTLTAPVLKKTWFRVGAKQDDDDRADYYAGDAKAPSLGATRWLDHDNQPIARPDAVQWRALCGRVRREEVYGADETPAAAHPYTVTEYRYQVREMPNALGASVLLPMPLEQLSIQYERLPDDPLITHEVLLQADTYGYSTDAATVHYPRRINPAVPDGYQDTQQQPLRVTRTQHGWIHLNQSNGPWRLGLPCEVKTQAVQLLEDSSAWLDYEQLSDGRLNTAPHELIGWQRLDYVDTEGAKLPLGQATVQGLGASTRQAEVTLAALEHACEGLPAPEDLEHWVEQARYQWDEGYYWIASPHAYYLGPDDFYRLGHQTDVFGAETHLDYDASGYCVTCVTDALGHITQAEYDYRRLQPTCVIDANENRHEAAYDPLGRVRVTSFYGTQGEKEVGFAPVRDYRTDVYSLEAALADPAGAIRQAASVYYDALFNWMGQLDVNARRSLSDTEQQQLCDLGLITRDAHVRARYQWSTAAPAGLSPERWVQIRSLLSDASRAPVQTASFMHDSYPNDAQRQIRCTVAFTDGFGRALQTKQRVASGPAWTADTHGNLVLQNGRPVSQHTDTRWAVSGRVEYNNKGLAVRMYQPYFIDTPGYVTDVSLRQGAPHDTLYYDPLGRPIRVHTAAGYERRSRFAVWFDTHEDENDTRAQPGDRCHDTPTVAVRDNRGLTVREVQYNRVTEDSERQVLVTRHEFDASGALVSSADPRLGAQGQCNFSYLRTLTGQLLRTHSVDAGTQLQLRDARGLLVWAATGNGHRQRWSYDELSRPTARFEQSGGASEACRERFVYGATDSDAAHNCRGQLVRHCDPSGLTRVDDYALTGQPLSEARSFLVTLNAPDWPEGEAVQTALLEPERHTTFWTYNALGEMRTHTDAGGHCRRFEYDTAGRLRAVWLRLAKQDERCVTSDFTYNAAGQPLQVRAGNGVVRTYTYEAGTQRLTSLCTQREGTALQDLSYTYDPVGNITRIEDTAQPVRYTRNQRVEAASTYQYDALYQLVQATGRESAQAGQQSNTLPPWHGLDDTQRVNYTRDYTYDAGGNLHRIQHTGAQRYTFEMTVAAGSNRAVPGDWTKQPDCVDPYFDANGNVAQLQMGQPLTWDASGQLSGVTQMARTDTADDDERYGYDGAGQRVRKVRRWYAGSQRHIDEVRYLPGLEWRERWQAATDNAQQSNINERLQVIVVDAGGITVRILHWELGQPEAINNDQLRYSLDNHLGSSTIELDAAGQLLTYEEYYPYGGTAVWAAKSEIEAKYKTVRYSGKERDATGLYYYGLRYYQPWVGRWLSADPAGTVDGLNLFGFVKNNPLNYVDDDGASAKDIALDAFDAILVVRKSAKKNLGIYRMSNTEVSIRAPINIISSAASIPIKGVVDVLTAPFFPVGPNPANIGTRVAFGLMQRNIYPNLVRASEYMNTDFLERQIHKKGPDKAVEALTFGVEPIAEALPIKSLKLQQDMERVDNSWKRLEGLTREKVEADYKETSKLLELVKQKEAAGLSALSQLDKPISGLDLHLYKLKRLEKAPISKAKAMENLDARLLERSAREATIYLEKLKSDLHDKLYPADKLRRRINANLNINQLRSGMHAYMAGKKWQRWAAAKSA